MTQNGTEGEKSCGKFTTLSIISTPICNQSSRRRRRNGGEGIFEEIMTEFSQNNETSIHKPKKVKVPQIGQKNPKTTINKQPHRRVKAKL